MMTLPVQQLAMTAHITFDGGRFQANIWLMVIAYAVLTKQFICSALSLSQLQNINLTEKNWTYRRILA